MEKDCKIIFCDKKTYDFNSNDLAKALAWCKDKRVYAIKTPWCILTLMSEEEFENVASCMFEPHPDTSFVPEDLV